MEPTLMQQELEPSLRCLSGFIPARFHKIDSSSISDPCLVVKMPAILAKQCIQWFAKAIVFSSYYNALEMDFHAAKLQTSARAKGNRCRNRAGQSVHRARLIKAWPPQNQRAWFFDHGDGYGQVAASPNQWVPDQ